MTASCGELAPSTEAGVIWHELECGGYREDLALWRSLAAETGGPVLEIGAGTGRVTLDLARAGHRMTALDRDPSLLAELSRRARELPVTAIVADAREFELAARFALCIVPMQTIQLLGGASGRWAFLRRARRHLYAGGLLAVAVAESLEVFRVLEGAPAPPPDTCQRAGVTFSSRPTAVLADAQGYVLERRRETTAPDGAATIAYESVHIDRLTSAQLEAEAVAAGIRPERRVPIRQTLKHAGSMAVVLRA